MRGPQVVGTIAAVLLGAAIGAGVHAAIAAPPTPAAKPAPVHFSRYHKLDVFARALATIEQHYVRPVDGERLVHSAITGLVAELDPHSDFLPPREARLLREDIEGSFGGVGMMVIQRFEPDPEPRLVLEVREVVPGGPAARAGVRAGDLILNIEDKPVSHYVDLRRAISTMRGQPGTRVKFTFERSGEAPRTVHVVREVIDSPAVIVRYLGGGVGHVRLRDFSESAARELEDGLESLRQSASETGLRGVVLDLRDNGGGLLDQAIAVVDLFVASGAIVRTRGRQGGLLDEVSARPGGRWNEVPLAVVVNKASASASEVVAGALQDHRRAVVVGERTYGKGSVQAPFELGDGSVLKLTIALYYTPNDRLIQATGIVPDVVVGPDAPVYKDSMPELDPERAHPRHLRPDAFGYAPRPDTAREASVAAGEDAQLRAAIEHLQTLSSVAPPRPRSRR